MGGEEKRRREWQTEKNQNKIKRIKIMRGSQKNEKMWNKKDDI